MSKIFSIVNQKGGVAKTTTAINLAACLTKLGKRLLIIDFDPQANLTTGVGISANGTTIYDCLVKEIPLVKSIYTTDIENLDIVPANIQLANAELELSSTLGRETLLRDLIESAGKLNYDYIIIDCNPSLGLLTVNALTSCDSIIIPMEAGIFALQGIEQLIKVIKLVKKKLNSKLDICGVLLTRVDSRTNIAKDFLDELRNIFQDKVFETCIHQNVRIPESQTAKTPISVFDSNSKGAQEYMQLAREVINRG